MGYKVYKITLLKCLLNLDFLYQVGHFKVGMQPSGALCREGMLTTVLLSCYHFQAILLGFSQLQIVRFKITTLLKPGQGLKIGTL